MSVRIYELSKEIGMENAELIQLLKKRGYQVKSASSTIDNISAESLRDEFTSSPEEAAAAEPSPAAEAAPEAAPAQAAPAPQQPPQAGMLVRSKEEVERERRRLEEEERRQSAPRVVVPPPPAALNRKAPPPLPRGPAVTIRPEAPKAAPPRTPAAPRPPGAPTLASGAPAARAPAPPPARPGPAAPPKAPAAPMAPGKPPETPPAQQRSAPPAPPPAARPAPAAPPRVSAPPKPPAAPVPPPIQGPKTVAPPAAKPDEAPAEAAASAPAPNLRKLTVKTPIVVRDFAVQIGRKPFQVISELMEQGIFASMNTTIEEAVAQRIAGMHGYQLEIRHRGESAPQAQQKPKAETPQAKRQLESRPPVVVILGHVDHGKTTLLDTIRKANVVATEAGGITQHIGAYQVEHNAKKITFIDTPGHAAFSNMRARGANVTDIAVLVVAADDGFMPQTDEALGHARTAGVPVVVAINKTDMPGANVDRVMRQMQERDLAPEEWGGETLSAQVSALKGEGIEGLLESILLQTEIMDTIQADPRGTTEGVVLEAQKELGIGSTASVLVREGTLKAGAAIVCGEHYCRVRQLISDRGERLKSATPGTPVKVVGWSGPPDAGDVFHEVKNERTAKKEAEANELQRKQLEAAQREDGEASLDDLFAAIAKTQKKTYRVIVKADVYGTAEALATSLLNIKSDKIDLEVIDTGVGAVTKNDVLMADAAEGAAVVAFNVGLDQGVGAFAKHHDVTVISHDIIYELIDRIKDAMADLLEPELRENKIGAAEVRAVFPLGKGFVAGCMVTEGLVRRDAPARLFRKGEQEAIAKIDTLKRFKEDATEVRAGFECGIGLENHNDYAEGDTIEVFEILKIKPSL